MQATELLRTAGWFPGRKVDVIALLGALVAEDFEVTKTAAGFLREFSGLAIVGPGNRNPLVIGGPDLPVDADSGWCDLYSEAIGSRLTPIGEYSNMVLYIDPEGSLWGGFDQEYGRGGDSLEDVVGGLILDHSGWRFDRRVEVPLTDRSNVGPVNNPRGD